MPVSKPTPGATGWNTAVDAVIDIANSVADLPTRVTALEAGGIGDVTEAELAAGLATKAPTSHVHTDLLDQATGDNRYILQTNAGTFAPADATTTALAGKVAKSANLSDLASIAAARTNLGLADVMAQLLTATGDGTADDTASINTQLAAAPAGTVLRGVPGKNYLISAPIVLRAGGNQILDMTGCTVTLKAGSNCNMVNNAAVGSVRRILDVVATAASTTITSATAAFVSGDVGKPITINGAGTGGAPHTTTIASVTNGTAAVLTAAAVTTVVDQYAALGARDSDITVQGGLWDRGANTTSGAHWLAHSLRFRHVDRLKVRDIVYTSTAGKYAVNPGDCTDYVIERVHFPSNYSDGVHMNGPCRGGTVRDITGDTMGDDLVSFTARDSTPLITDCFGDITDVVVDNARYKTAVPSLFASVLKVVAGAGCTVRNLTVRNLTGPVTTAAVAYVGDTSGGVLDDITIDGVRSLGSATGFDTVYLNNGIMDRIRVRRVTAAPTDRCPVRISGTVTAGRRISVSEVDWDGGTTGQGAVTVDGTVETLTIDGVRSRSSVSGSSVLLLTNGLTPKPSVARALISNVHLEPVAGVGAALLRAEDSGATLAVVEIVNATCVNVNNPLGLLSTVTDLHVVNVAASGASMASWIRVKSGGNVTVRGASGLRGAVDGTTVDAGGSLQIAARNATALNSDPDLLVAGEETVDRRLVSNSGLGGTSGRLWLTYFTARKTETITQIRTLQGNAAAATPTLCRIGVYDVAVNGDLTLVASTANDTALWTSTFSPTTKALSASWSKVAGKRYAIGFLAVAATAPKWLGVAPVLGLEAAQSPRLAGNVDSQTDLPSTVTAGTIANSGGTMLYAVAVP